MSMFSGLSNQISGISGMVAQKLGKGGAEAGAEGEGQAEAVPQAVQEMAENGEELLEEGQQQAAAGGGGVQGLAQGLLAKAMTAKDGIKEKAANFQAPNLQGLGNNLMQGVTNLIPGRREEDVPTPPEPNPPSELGGEMVEAEDQGLE